MRKQIIPPRREGGKVSTVLGSCPPECKLSPNHFCKISVKKVDHDFHCSFTHCRREWNWLQGNCSRATCVNLAIHGDSASNFYPAKYSSRRCSPHASTAGWSAFRCWSGISWAQSVFPFLQRQAKVRMRLARAADADAQPSSKTATPAAARQSPPNLS